MNNFALQLKYRKPFKKLVLGLLGFIGAEIILYLTRFHGAGIMPDSVAYISVARNLAEGHGFLTYNGLYLIVQPPLYPVILAIIQKVVLVDPQTSSVSVNAFLFGAIIYFSGLLLLKRLKSFVLVFLGAASVLISFALVQASSMALSEPLFIFLLVLFLYYFEAYRTKVSTSSLLLFSISAALACLTRYTGTAIVLTGIVCIFFWGSNKIKEKFMHSLIFILITVLPIGIWVLRNYYLSGSPLGQRGASSYNIFQNINFYFDTVISWYFPLNSAGFYFIFILLLFAAWMIFGVVLHKPLKSDTIKIIGPSLLFLIIYTATIIISSATTAYDQIADRLLSPIYIPLIIILFVASDNILAWLTNYFHLKIISVVFIIGIIMLMQYPAKNTIHFIEEYNQLAGWGYSCDAWRESETIEYLKQHEELGKSYSLYSNEPEAVYFLTNLKTKRSPAKTFYNSPQLYNINPKQRDDWKSEDTVCLVWFDQVDRSFLFPIEEMKQNINMTKIAHLKDGEIYTFTIK